MGPNNSIKIVVEPCHTTPTTTALRFFSVFLASWSVNNTWWNILKICYKKWRKKMGINRPKLIFISKPINGFLPSFLKNSSPNISPPYLLSASIKYHQYFATFSMLSLIFNAIYDPSPSMIMAYLWRHRFEI